MRFSSSSNLAAACLLLIFDKVNGQFPGIGGPGFGNPGGPGGNNFPWQNGGPSPTSPDGESQPLTGAALQNTYHVLAAHAVLACLAWLFFIPFGGIILRLGIQSPWVVRIHAACQLLAYGVYIIAAGMGIWLARQFSSFTSVWSDPHPILGLIILIIALVQPISGYIHHQRYKRRRANAPHGRPKAGRTTLSRFHISTGRFLMIMAVINGGLGLRAAGPLQSASTTENAKIIYAVLSSWMAMLYIGITWSFESRKATQERSEHILLKSKYNSNPPSYDESEESLRTRH
jgi:hypothetical protein